MSRSSVSVINDADSGLKPPPNRPKNYPVSLFHLHTPCPASVPAVHFSFSTSPPPHPQVKYAEKKSRNQLSHVSKSEKSPKFPSHFHIYWIPSFETVRLLWVHSNFKNCFVARSVLMGGWDGSPVWRSAHVAIMDKSISLKGVVFPPQYRQRKESRAPSYREQASGVS